MGKITILHNGIDPRSAETIEFDGPFIEFLEKRFPDGFERPCKSVDVGTGSAIEWEAMLEPVGERHLAIAFTDGPEGFDPITIAIAVVVAVAVSVAVAFLLAPKLPGQNEQTAGSVYGVTAQANTAKVNGIVPVQYGTYTRTPEYASQSYRIFENNEEIRYFLLCLGAGKYEVDEVYIGDTPESDLPASIVSYDVYLPINHNSALGEIETDFGIHENVATSDAVDQQELDQVNTTTSPITLNMTCLNGGDELEVNGGNFEAYDINAGDSITITDPSNISGTYTVQSVSYTADGFITIQETFPAGSIDTNTTFTVAKNSALSDTGPFVVNKSGTTTQKIEFDFEFPQGMYILDDESGDFLNITLQVTATIQEIDDNGDDVGAATASAFSFSGATNTPQRRTESVVVSAGRYKVSVKRTDSATLKASDAQRTLWTGLKAYLDYDSAQEVYGFTTILAMKITGAQGISGSAQQRIRVKSSRRINQLGTSTEVAGGNLADVFADIIIDDNYGAGRPYSEVNDTALTAFRTAQAGRTGFNGVFDTVMTVWNALEAVTSLGRTKPYSEGSVMSIVVDEVKPLQSTIITPDNIARGSLKVQYNWFEPGDNDGVEVEYRDPDTGEALYAIYPSLSVDPRRERAIGLTDETEALSMATYLYRQKLMRATEFSFGMERDAHNLNPFDRAGLIFPAFNWADAGHVKSTSGLNVTLSKSAPIGALSVVFRDQDGTSTDIVSAVGDGSKTIVLGNYAPITLVNNGQSVPTLCAFGLTSSFAVQDITILSVTPGRLSSSVKAVNYAPDLFNGLV